MKEDENIIVSIDGGKSFQSKVNETLQGSTSSKAEVPILPTSGWKTFPFLHSRYLSRFAMEVYMTTLQQVQWCIIKMVMIVTA